MQPHIVILGAGARGTAYATALSLLTNPPPLSIAEPHPSKRASFVRKYILGSPTLPHSHQSTDPRSFSGWKEWISHERTRRERESRGEGVEKGVEAVIVCTLDSTHEEILAELASLGGWKGVLCEKPAVTGLRGLRRVLRDWERGPGVRGREKSGGGSDEREGEGGPGRDGRGLGNEKAIFGVGHVLRYSPHNLLLKRLLDEGVVGEVVSVEHTEPVGWWHFSHSYVRGNWRKESTTAPSLLTKSCHDIDLLLWLLNKPHPSSPSDTPPHLPKYISSTGSLTHFKHSRKPPLAGRATKCLSCPAESECVYSAKKIYLENHLAKGISGWPVHIVDPEIEDIMLTNGIPAAEDRLLARLDEDYDESTPQHVIESRPWFGRCVYESDNDVCDDQVVTMTWEDEPWPPVSDIGMMLNGSIGTSLDQNSVPAEICMDSDPFHATHHTSSTSGQSPRSTQNHLEHRGAKTAIFHMIAHTSRQCQRVGRIYGTLGEVTYDSTSITVYDFRTQLSTTHFPPQLGGGHGGGDAGLIQAFVSAMQAVGDGKMSVDEAQKHYIGCTVEDIVRSHAMVFAAEEAKRERKVVEWKRWWDKNMIQQLK